MVKRERMARDLLLQSILPELLIAAATLLIVWFGVKRGLRPLARLSEEIKSRSAARPAADRRGRRARRDAAAGRRAERPARRGRRRRAASSSASSPTPRTSCARRSPACRRMPSSRSRSRCPSRAARRSSSVHQATIRTGRLANQLLALARAEPGVRMSLASLDLKSLVEGEADAWVHQALRARYRSRFRARGGADRRRRVPAARGACQPGAQRTRVFPARRPRHGAHRPARAAPLSSRWRTTGRESRRRSAAACWSASTACRAPRAPAAVWASRSCARSPAVTARALRSPIRPLEGAGLR